MVIIMLTNFQKSQSFSSSQKQEAILERLKHPKSQSPVRLPVQENHLISIFY